MHFIKSFYLNSLVALAYFFGGVIGSLLAVEPSNSSPVWPASGIALAVILINGRRILPGLFVGIFCTQLYISIDSISVDAILRVLLLTFINAGASCLQATVGAMLIRHFVGKQDVLLDLSEVLRFFFYGALLSCLIAPTICISVFYLQDILSASDFFFAWLTWWVGDVIGVFIFTPIVLAFFAQPESIWRPRKITVAAPLVLLLLLLVVVFFYSEQQEQDRINSLFEYRVERVQNVLQDEINQHKNIAESVADILHANKDVNADEFRVMTQAYLRHHPDLIAIEWTPRILDNPELDANTLRFQIKYAEPYATNTKAIGFDIMQNATVLKTLKEVISTGRALSTGLIHLIQDSEHYRVASVIYAPVYQKHRPTEVVTDKADYILGVAAVVFSIEDQRTSALSALVDNQLRIKITSNDNEVFYSNFVDDSTAPISFVSLQALRKMQAAGNDWQVAYRPSEKFFSSQVNWHVWWTLLGGLMLTSFAGVGLLILTGRTAHIAEQVELKTRDLSNINRQLNKEVILRQQLELEQLVRNSVLEGLAKGDEFAIILAEIVKGAEKLNPDSLCSILLLDEKGKRLMHGAANSLPAFYNEAINGLLIGPGVGSCGTAAYTGQRVIVEDIMTHPYWATVRKLARAAGIYACWSEPIISSKEKVLGTFGIYYREKKVPTRQDLDLIKRMADLTAITIERKQAEDELRIAATTFQSHDAVVITDVDGTIMRVNQAYTDVTGYSAAEVLGKNSRVLSSGRHDKAFFVNMFTSLAEKGKWEGEVWNRRKSGESYPERIIITAVYDGDEITHYVGIFSDISEKKATEEEIRRLAFYDSLTGLPNRRLLLDRLEQAIISAKRHNDFGAVIYMDLDRFKSLNDTLGHQVGDELLVQVAQRIEAVIRAEDTACRLGGDEFVVLVSRTDTELNEVIEQAAFIAEKIRKEINRPFELSGSMQSFSTSIGVSVFPDQVDLAEEILEQADTAMYRSKQTGRNRVSFFSAQMQSEHNRKSSLERMLHAALDELQFVIYYQGQTNSAGEILSAEALLRWIHPEQGMVSPAEFIPVAEESHLIVEIGSWVLCEVCRQIKAWQDVGFYLDHVAVNISPRQFRQDDFVRQVEAAIAGSGIEAKYLMIEITEGIVIEDIQATIDKMLQIQAMGIAISIDDFGTGYSSLAYLKKLPLSQLKIDQSFVRDINIDTSDEVIVEAIIALAHKLDLEVIAEGVETKEQLHFLHEKGCDKYQGYYFYRPVSAEELFLKSERRTHNIS
ncbi:MAG: EAL domain-containing protein [Methyloprofundus sp.]|nr:EAL domain-containing protein [Methyloprofundus sp.]